MTAADTANASADNPTTAFDIKAHIADFPDFPKPGILFRDVAPLLRHHFPETMATLGTLLTREEWAQVDCVAGIESRGFMLGAGLAALHGKGFVKIRKKGKLPGRVAHRSYSLEYGDDALEMQYGSGRMLIVDDVLATGGTLGAAAHLAVETGHDVVALVCLVNLEFLNDFTWNGQRARCAVSYDS